MNATRQCPPEKLEQIAALMKAGKFKQALAKCEKSRRRYREDIDLLGLRASIQSAMGNTSGLQDSLRSAGKLASTYFKEKRRLDLSEHLCRMQLHYNEDNVEALRLLGLIAATMGNLEDAGKLLSRVLQLQPDYLQVKYELLDVIKKMDLLEYALELYEQLLKQHPEESRGHYEQAGVLAALGRAQGAASAYQACLAIAPTHIGALLGLGHMRKTQGNQRESIIAYQKARDCHPDNGTTWHSLSNLKTYLFEDEQIAEMETRVLKSHVKNTSSELSFHYTLGKAFEDRQQYSEAWAHYEQGYALKRQLEPYSSANNRANVDAIIHTFNKEFFQAIEGCGERDKAPIFILGMPRSGSTLVEQILASHSQVEGTSELPFINRLAQSLNCGKAKEQRYPLVLNELKPEQYGRLGQHYLKKSRAHRHENTSYFIDKMPNNFTAIGFIRAILPNAKVIDVRRSPMDVCVANLKHLYSRGHPYSYDQTDMAEYYLEYRRLMTHWDSVIPQWVLPVQYEDLVKNIEPQVRRILDFLELSWEEGCLDFHTTPRAVHTASSEQVRQPIYTNAVGFWRNYEPYLGELKEALGTEVASENR